jgi:hypothetical protein
VRFARLLFLLTALVASSALLGACGDDPLFPDVQLTTDTVTLTVPGNLEPSALDLARATLPFTLLRRPELVQDAAEWDVALRRTAAGGLSFLPFDQPGSPYRGAGIRTSTDNFDTIEEAPRATSAYGDDPVPVTVNAVYLFRSRQYPTQGGLCVNYARAKVVAVDAAAGTAQVAVVINRNCDDERLQED